MLGRFTARFGFVGVFASLACLVPVQAEGQPAPSATVKAADRGSPHLFLRDGQKVVTNYAGSFPTSQARPPALKK
jgi:hypothetical protein